MIEPEKLQFNEPIPFSQELTRCVSSSDAPSKSNLRIVSFRTSQPNSFLQYTQWKDVFLVQYGQAWTATSVLDGQHIETRSIFRCHSVDPNSLCLPDESCFDAVAKTKLSASLVHVFRHLQRIHLRKSLFTKVSYFIAFLRRSWLFLNITHSLWLSEHSTCQSSCFIWT